MSDLISINQDILHLSLAVAALVVFLICVILIEFVKITKLEITLRTSKLEFETQMEENDRFFREEVNNSYLIARKRTENIIKNMNSEELYEFLKN